MRNLLKLGLIAITLVLLFLPGIAHHWETANDRYFVPADAVQYIPAFFQYDRLDPVPTTYIKEYYLEAVCPPLYKWLTASAARFGDIRHVQLTFMYLAYAAFILIIGRLGWLLGGAPLSFAVLVLTLTAWIFLGLGFMGGAPRMYAYPLMSLVIYSLITDRPLLLAAVTLLGAALYPIAGMIGGLCLTLWLLVKPLAGRGRVSDWSWFHRFAAVGVTGLTAFAILIPLILGSGPYGRRIVPADIQTYPEAGPDGNYRAYDQLPYQLFGQESLAYYLGPLYAHGDPLLSWTNVFQAMSPGALLLVMALFGLIILCVIVAGVRLMLRSEDRHRVLRLIGFFATCGILHIASWIAAPYLYIPARYFMFSLPFLITLVFPWCLYAILKATPYLGQSGARRDAAFLAAIALYLLLFGGRGNVAFSGPPPSTAEKQLYDAVAALPKDSLIAGWPVGPLRKAEYISRRNAFLTGDLHQVLHESFLLTMRQRMDAVFDAYLSTDAAPLKRLHHEFGVTHLIVDTRDFTDPEHAPEYFSPWRARIQPRLRAIKAREYLLNPSLEEKAAIFRRDSLLLLDLKRLP